MPKQVCNNRLTIVGPRAEVKAFSESSWEVAVEAKHVELLEASPNRMAWQFETEAKPPLIWLLEISSRWPSLTFVLDYEQEKARFKGLAKAKGGAVEHYRIKY
jgi:hypothetical protein